MILLELLLQAQTFRVLQKIYTFRTDIWHVVGIICAEAFLDTLYLMPIQRLLSNVYNEKIAEWLEDLFIHPQNINNNQF